MWPHFSRQTWCLLKAKLNRSEKKHLETIWCHEDLILLLQCRSYLWPEQEAERWSFWQNSGPPLVQDTAWMSKKSCGKRTETLKITNLPTFSPCASLTSLFHTEKSGYENCSFSSISTTFQAQSYCATPFKSSYSTVLSPKLFATALNMLRQWFFWQ